MSKRMTVLIGLLCVLLMPSIVGQAQRGTSKFNTTLAQGSEIVEIGNLITDEDFSNTDAWDSYKEGNASINIQRGELRLSLVDEGSLWTQTGSSYEDVIVIAEARELSEDNNQYGITCRAAESANGDAYYFTITEDGFASIYKSVDDEWIFLEDWTEIDTIDTDGASNELMAVCSGSYLAFYVNGQLALETVDTTYTDGDAGFFVATFDDSNSIEVAFDNLQIYDAIGTVGTAGMPPTLDNHGEDWEEAVAELEALGIIGDGGSLVFNVNRAFFDGVGSWFEPLARSASHRDIVMAATLDFTVGGDEYESCGLMARTRTDPQSSITSTFLEVGFDNNGVIYWLDLDDGDGDNGIVRAGLDLDEPHHLLFLALNEELSVYVDGELVFDRVAITQRSGSFGITLIGSGATSRCEGTQVWAYAAPIFVPGLCEVVAGGTVNRRSGPGTNFDLAGALNTGQRSEVVGQSTGSDNFTWYQLADDAWIREDIISLQGDCGSIPAVK